MAAADIETPQCDGSVPDTINDEPISISPRRIARHHKGLSLSFPILLPTNDDSHLSSSRSVSPTRGSGRTSPHMKAESSPSLSQPLFPATKTSSDFLTLVASQERRVLELKEELARAETELNSLKIQWAAFEANKKREHAKRNRVSISLDEMSIPSPRNDEEMEEERRRRRALVELSNNSQNHTTSSAALGRKGSKRVFEGRHTRTLSLLNSTAQKRGLAPPSTFDELLQTNNFKEDDKSTNNQTPGTTQSTWEGLISPEALQLSFGKTYKELAAHRKSLQPAAADIFMKQGKQMVEGVREGLWTFFEDMRQATVGEEAMNAPLTSRRTPRNVKPRVAKTTSTTSQNGNTEQPRLKDDSFWREFGLDTPQRISKPVRKDLKTGHGQQKSSTNSQKPPELLPDTKENDNEMEDWDNWESSPTGKLVDGSAKAVVVDGDGLPWPELKDTPSKLKRTANALLQEWQGDPGYGQVSSIL